MSRSKRGMAVLTAIVAVLAIGALAAGPAAATRTVTIPSTLQISVYSYFGKVKAPNSACLGERKVVLKQKGYGVLGRDTTDETGAWKVDPESIHYKGPLPYKVFAEVKPLSQGTAGTIYKCLGATSKTNEIAGG